MCENRLLWLPEPGIGFFPVTAQPYDAAYFANYVERADTEIGRRLNAARLAMLGRHWHGAGVVDIGIGSGAFVESRPYTLGYDVNPIGIAWLKTRGLFCDPYSKPFDVATLWDSLEHILDPSPLLANVRERILVAIPIFRGLDHLLESKHYKKEEHAWYFTRHGFLAFMWRHGWRCIEINDDETKAGREDIESFAFRRA